MNTSAKCKSSEEKEGKFEKGKSVPVSRLPDELQENVRNPPPGAKKLKEKLKDKNGADASLRKAVIRLAAQREDLRPHLLPLLRTAKAPPAGIRVPRDVYLRAGRRWMDALDRKGFVGAVRATEIRIDRIKPGSEKAAGIAEYLKAWMKEENLKPAEKTQLKKLISKAQAKAKTARVAGLITPDDMAGKDNSWGRGFYPLPEKLKALPRFSDAFRHVVDHKVFPDEGTHMLTVPLRKVSLWQSDMRYMLLKLGLERIISNSTGTLSFYFRDAAWVH